MFQLLSSYSEWLRESIVEDVLNRLLDLLWLKGILCTEFLQVKFKGVIRHSPGLPFHRLGHGPTI